MELAKPRSTIKIIEDNSTITACSDPKNNVNPKIKLLEVKESEISQFNTPDCADAFALNLKEKGNLCLKTKDYAGALDFYTKAIAISPNFKELYGNRAVVHLEMKNPEQAINDCNTVLKFIEQHG